MNVVVIGGVAAGTKTAAKLMRQDRKSPFTPRARIFPMLAAACPTMLAAASKAVTS